MVGMCIRGFIELSVAILAQAQYTKNVFDCFDTFPINFGFFVAFPINFGVNPLWINSRGFGIHAVDDLADGKVLYQLLSDMVPAAFPSLKSASLERPCRSR